MIPDSRSVIRKAYDQKGYSCKGKYASYSKWCDKNTKLFYGKKYGCADWCAIFVIFCIAACSGRSNKDAAYTACIPLKSYAASVRYFYRYMKARGRNTSIPHYGDVVFLKNTKGKLGHVGLVYDVDDKYIHYIAGNEKIKKNGKSRQAVRTHKLLRNSSKIYAYGRPRYSDWKDI